MSTVQDKPHVENINRHLQKLQNLLNNEEISHPTESESVEEKSRSNSTVEVVVFDDPRKRRKNNSKTTTTELSKKAKIDSNPQNRPINFLKARHEVEQFGINGFAKEKKAEAKVALAIRLGAKPPKNKYVNYKTLMEEKRADKESTADIPDDHYTIKNRKSNRKQRKTSKDAIKKFDKDFGKVNKTRKRRRKN